MYRADFQSQTFLPCEYARVGPVYVLLEVALTFYVALCMQSMNFPVFTDVWDLCMLISSYLVLTYSIFSLGLTVSWMLDRSAVLVASLYSFHCSPVSFIVLVFSYYSVFAHYSTAPNLKFLSLPLTFHRELVLLVLCYWLAIECLCNCGQVKLLSYVSCIICGGKCLILLYTHLRTYWTKECGWVFTNHLHAAEFFQPETYPWCRFLKQQHVNFCHRMRLDLFWVFPIELSGGSKAAIKCIVVDVARDLQVQVDNCVN